MEKIVPPGHFCSVLIIGTKHVLKTIDPVLIGFGKSAHIQRGRGIIAIDSMSNKLCKIVFFHLKTVLLQRPGTSYFFQLSK